MKIDLSDEELVYLIKALVNTHGDDHSDFDAQDISDQGMNGKLIGKLTSANPKLGHNGWLEARRNRFSKNEIRKEIFLGCGNNSGVQVNQLHKRLAFAVSELSAIQQNGGMGTEFDYRMDIECRNNIKSVLQDIIMAFGFKPEDLV